ARIVCERRHAAPRSVGRSSEGTGRAVRAVRDEHRDRDPAGDPRLSVGPPRRNRAVIEYPRAMISSKTQTAGSFRQTVTVGGRTLESDSDGSAPSPHDYFCASLAACKTLTAHAYAKHKGYALDRIEVDVDRDDSEEKQGKYKLKVSVRFFGALSE